MGGIELRPIELGEFPGFYSRLVRTLGDDFTDENCSAYSGVFEPDRSLAVFDGNLVVATSSLASRWLTIPGAVIPVAAGIMASVAPTHRRRGLLRAIKERQRDSLRECEGVLVSWPSEAAIYGRYGYGAATRQGVMTGSTSRLRIRPELVPDDLVVREVEPVDAVSTLREVYSAVSRASIGWLSRPAGWWALRLHDPVSRRAGWGALRGVVCENRSGVPSGYAVYRIRSCWDVNVEHRLDVVEVAGTTVEAYARLWQFLLSIDLVRHLQWQCAPAAPALELMVTDPRAVELRLRDGMWVWLVDLPRALSSRRYHVEFEAVIDVTDAFCPWNAGRWLLAGGPDGASCERTQRSVDITATSSDLAAAYLGSTPLTTLHLAGRVGEVRCGTVGAVSAAMRWEPAAFCPEIF